MARYYVATMEPYGAEGQARIARHRKLRDGKGFMTVECPVHLERLQLPEPGAVLIEDLSNLLANEIWSEASGCDGPSERAGDGLLERVCQAVLRLSCAHRLLVLVGNDIHRDAVEKNPQMERFLELTGSCHARLSAAADEVVEVVCGIPLRLK